MHVDIKTAFFHAVKAKKEISTLSTHPTPTTIIFI